MESFSIQVADIPRQFNIVPKVKALGYAPDAFSTYKGIRTTLDVSIRLSCPLPNGIDIVDGVAYEHAFPHVIVRLPGTYHESRIPVPREVFYFAYPGSARELLANLGFTFPLPCWETQIAPRMSEVLHRICECALHSHEKGMADRIDILCLELLEELIVADVRTMKSEEYNEHKIRKIASYLQLHYNDDFSLDQLIAANGLSRRSFFRYWKRYSKLSPLNYIMDLKMKEASQLLLQSDMQVEMIAEHLNFLNATYFCRMFKQKFGVTPLQYRKKA